MYLKEMPKYSEIKQCIENDVPLTFWVSPNQSAKIYQITQNVKELVTYGEICNVGKLKTIYFALLMLPVLFIYVIIVAVGNKHGEIE